MAKRGEIDPWNINVVDVTDRFLKRIEAAKKLDLRVSGRVLLYAAILIRMKAEAITLEAIGELEEEVEDYFPYFIDEPIEFPEYEYEEEEMEDTLLEILSSQRRRIRKITTLKDLIDELRRAEEVEKRRRRRRRAQRQDVTIEAALKVPHEESLEETIARVEREIFDVLRRSGSTTLFSLVKRWDISTLVDYYISILHLTFRRRILIEQEEFYGDIEIQRCDI
ncbi:segregation/condensation protein A [Archaeoglobus sp. JdFR-39]|jgi:segregation and condensation protein A|uniref:segregation/condensation protein A n=1 Tax=Archaeoglobus sp. JdFR-39 TaxID=1934996 RepID=UPI0025C2A96D|nr:ScpA family protein [Archaeoglobus sp. JdFR-39]